MGLITIKGRPEMKRTDFSLVIITTVALLAAIQVRGAVKVETESEETAESKVEPAGPGERLVAFRTVGNRFITMSPTNALDLTGVKLGTRQTFTLIDVTGGELADGHGIRIRYTARNGKASYWLENKLGIRRGSNGDVFKIKRVGAKVALVTATGKFVAPPITAIALGVSDRQEGALLVEILDPATKTSILKAADQPAPAPSETAPPVSTPPPAAEKSESAP
jgi:hypothetical protein